MATRVKDRRWTIDEIAGTARRIVLYRGAKTSKQPFRFKIIAKHNGKTVCSSEGYATKRARDSAAYELWRHTLDYDCISEWETSDRRTRG